MSFIAKNPLILPEVEAPSAAPIDGTRGIFAGKDGFYEVDSNNNKRKLLTSEDIEEGASESIQKLDSLHYYGDMNIVPSDSGLFGFTTDNDTMTAAVSTKSVDISGDIVIPYKYEFDNKTYMVTSIEEYAFFNCTKLTSITIPNSVTSIGNGVFYGCTGLASITIPDSITSIGTYAFCGCDKLTSIAIPNSVTSIGDYAFAECTSLTDIIIPNSVTNINNCAFFNCSSIISVIIPGSITSVGEDAFANNNRLTNIYYEGTQEQWNLISIAEEGNDALLNATIHYEHIPTTKGYVDEEISKIQISGGSEIIDLGYTNESIEEYFKNIADDGIYKIKVRFTSLGGASSDTVYAIVMRSNYNISLNYTVTQIFFGNTEDSVIAYRTGVYCFPSFDENDVFTEEHIEWSEMTKVGGGSDIIVDQTYSSESPNAQSGKAVAEAIANLIGTAPESLDTIQELAEALDNNADVVEVLNNAISNKVDKVKGKDLSSNDFSDAEKSKLENIKITDLGIIEDLTWLDNITDEGIYYFSYNWEAKLLVVTHEFGYMITITNQTLLPDNIIRTYTTLDETENTDWFWTDWETLYADKIHTHSYNDLTDKPEIPTVAEPFYVNFSVAQTDDAGNIPKLQSDKTALEIREAVEEGKNIIAGCILPDYNNTYLSPKLESYDNSLMTFTLDIEDIRCTAFSEISSNTGLWEIYSVTNITMHNADDFIDGYGHRIINLLDPRETNDATTKGYVDEIVGNKVTKEEGKGLSTNDYTNEDKNKLDKTTYRFTVVDNADEVKDAGVYVILSGASSEAKLLLVTTKDNLSIEPDVTQMIIGIDGHIYERQLAFDDKGYGIWSDWFDKSVSVILVTGELELEKDGNISLTNMSHTYDDLLVAYNEGRNLKLRLIQGDNFYEAPLIEAAELLGEAGCFEFATVNLSYIISRAVCDRDGWRIDIEFLADANNTVRTEDFESFKGDLQSGEFEVDRAIFANLAINADYAQQANNDGYGNPIDETYATKAELRPTPITEIPATLSPNTSYNFGEVESLQTSFPTIATDGDVIYLTFMAKGENTNIAIEFHNASDIDIEIIPNTGYEIYAKYNGSIWIVGYSEYTVTDGESQ